MAETSTSFKPGDQRASEAGKKSKRKPLDQKLAELAAELDSDNGMTNEDSINRVLIEKAKKGDIAFIKEYLDRRYGKAKQSVELTGEDGGPIENKVIIEFVNPDNEVSG